MLKIVKKEVQPGRYGSKTEHVHAGVSRYESLTTLLIKIFPEELMKDRGGKQLTLEEKWDIETEMPDYVIESDGRHFWYFPDGSKKEVKPGDPDDLRHI